jgi:hypothetical protein
MLLQFSPPPYNWSDFRIDYDEDLWQLYMNIMASIENSSMILLDQLTFTQFVDFCIKNTSKPVEPPEKYELDENDIQHNEDDNEQQQVQEDEN